MRGIILSGGSGVRLSPLTQVTNKHLLPVYNQSMLMYPLNTLVSAGIEDILIVVGGEYASGILKLLGNGRKFGVKNLQYAFQGSDKKGIADALSYAEDFSDGQKIVVMLGDNIIGGSIEPFVQKFISQNSGARVLLKSVINPGRFGVAELQNDKIITLEEKPEMPKSNFIVTGIYMYPPDVFDVISTLEPSAREELEITDVNKYYLEQGVLEYDILNEFWSDCGTFESLFRASSFIASQIT